MKPVLLILLLGLYACSPSPEDLANIASQQFRESGETEETWLHDGELHFSTAFEWQKASFQNKRATSSDFLLTLDEQGRLVINIADNQSLKIHSEELTRKLNKQFEIIGPAVHNKNKYKDQLISDSVVLIASQNGWLKNI